VRQTADLAPASFRVGRSRRRLLLILLWRERGYWWQKPLPALDISALAATSSLDGQYQVEALFAEYGIRQAIPKQFRYNLLVSSGMEKSRGSWCPAALRESGWPVCRGLHLTNKDFNLAAGSEAASGNYLLMPDADLNRAFLVRYGRRHGRNWLFPESSGEA